MFSFLDAQTAVGFYADLARIVCLVLVMFGMVGGIYLWLYARGEVIDKMWSNDPDRFVSVVSRLVTVGVMILLVALGMFYGGCTGAFLGMIIAKYHALGVIGSALLMVVTGYTLYRHRMPLRRAFGDDGFSSRIDDEYRDLCTSSE